MTDAQKSTEEIIELLTHLLNDTRFKQETELEEACEQYPELCEVVETIRELRRVTKALSKGELNEPIPSRGFVLSSIKALQSNLSHLVWQLNQVAKGDFSQRLDFLGDFSETFNLMSEELEGQHLILNELARRDALTKLANRQYLDEYLAGLFDGDRESDADFSLMMIDLDYFKNVNDTYGHDAGDVVLESVARYLRQVFRSTDFLARYGGEEFIAILPHVPLAQAQTIAERALEYFAQHPIPVRDDVVLNVTVSIGITASTDEDVSADTVVKRSDEALYAAKENGRNCVVCA